MSPAEDVRRLTIHCYQPTDVTFTQGPVGLDEDQIQLWFMGLSNPNGSRNALWDPLTDEERSRADRFVFEKDRDRFIVGHALLRVLLGEMLSLAPELVPIKRGVHGKPFVPGTDLRFNLSDTKDAIAIGISRGHEIGIDVETLARRVDHQGVSEHYFTAPEIALIQEAGDHAKRRFLELWTRKEAVLKASGVGIMEDLHSLRVDGTVNTLTIRHKEFIRMAEPQYHVETFAIGEDHIVSTASGGRLRTVLLDAVPHLGGKG